MTNEIAMTAMLVLIADNCKQTQETNFILLLISV